MKSWSLLEKVQLARVEIHHTKGIQLYALDIHNAIVRNIPETKVSLITLISSFLTVGVANDASPHECCLKVVTTTRPT